MAKSRRQIRQAQRNTPVSTSPSFQWRKSYNWIFLLLPLILAGAYLTQVEQPLPIRTTSHAGPDLGIFPGVTFESQDLSVLDMGL